MRSNLHVMDAPRQFFLVVSPTSGGGAAKRDAPDLIQRLRSAGAEVEAEFTESLDHGRRLATEAARTGKTVVAVGGDGLINSVVNGLATVPDAIGGLLPYGTANDLARELGITKRNAIEVLLDGFNRPIDLGYAAGKYFTCIASVGFDSTVIETMMQTSHIKGRFVWPYSVLKSLITWKPLRFTVQSNGETVSFEGFSVAAANGKCFGSGMHLAPDAKLDDGLFDVVIIATRSRLEFLRWSPFIFNGGHLRCRAVKVWRTNRLTVDTATPFLVYAGGEVLAPTPLEIELRPAALRMLTPAS
jgi:YegS/Rv2252/BmrU family lipid kinase